MTESLPFSKPSRILITLAAVVLVIAGIKAAAPIIGPLAFSVFLAVIFGTLLHALERRGYSTRSSLVLTLVILFAIVGIFVVVIAGSFLQLVPEIPRYQGQLDESLELAGPLLSPVGIDPASVSFQDLIHQFSAGIGRFIGGLFNMAVGFIVVLITTLFLLFEAKGFSSKLKRIIGELYPGELDRFIELAQKNVDYILIRTEVNLAMGIGTTVILAVIGVKYAIFWGFFAFLMGFIPYIGFYLAVIPPAILAWFDIGPVAALVVLAGEGVVNTLVEYGMFPQLAGRGLALSAAVVFISLFFWGWVLGAYGVLLAVPLTLAVRMGCELFDETRWIGVLLGPSPET